MAIIRMDTPQHREGKKWEDFIRNELKRNGFKIYEPEEIDYDIFLLPKEIESCLNGKQISMLQKYPVDFFLIKDDSGVTIVEVKSKTFTGTKEDRRIDTSADQLDAFNQFESAGLKVVILVLWHNREGSEYFYHFFDWEDIKVKGGKKKKLIIPKEVQYSPDHVEYFKVAIL